MNGPPAILCPTCHVLRPINDWRAHGDSLAITLEPCGHVALREAGEEWHPTRAVPPARVFSCALRQAPSRKWR